MALDYGPQKSIMINPHVLEYETVVSLAQHKVHEDATVTLSLKNIAMSYPAADYYGHPRLKQEHPHRIFDDVQKFITGMCKKFPIHCAIITGHPAMVGTGPVGGETFESGVTIASRDAVAADAIGAKILGFESVPHIVFAEEQGIGTATLEDIKVSGVPLFEASGIFKVKRKMVRVRA